MEGREGPAHPDPRSFRHNFNPALHRLAILSGNQLLRICLKYNEESDKTLKEVKTNNYKNSKEGVITDAWSFKECLKKNKWA